MKKMLIAVFNPLCHVGDPPQSMVVWPVPYVYAQEIEFNDSLSLASVTEKAIREMGKRAEKQIQIVHQFEPWGKTVAAHCTSCAYTDVPSTARQSC